MGNRAESAAVTWERKDLVLRVPEGTVIKESVTGKVIADMSRRNRRQVVLKGGRGGLGNQHFATSTMQVPKYAAGQPARELEVNAGEGDCRCWSDRFPKRW